MNKTFEELYNNWARKVYFKSTGLYNDSTWDELLKWCRKNKDDFKSSMLELLSYEPTNAVHLLDEVYGNPIETDGFIPLETYCNFWICILKGYFDDINGTRYKKLKDLPNYYWKYDKWKKYMDKNYLVWRPNLEDDPNITRKDFDVGLRNNPKAPRKWRDFSLTVLRNDELRTLKKCMPLGDMTTHIIELKDFYNKLDEEIKRREENDKHT